MDNLPFDVLYLIFEYVNISDSRNVKLTCRRFYNIAKMVRFSGHVTIHKEKSSIIPKCKNYTLLGNPDKLPTNVLQDTFRWSNVKLCTGNLTDKYHSFIYAKSFVAKEIANEGMVTLPNAFENVEDLRLISFKSLNNIDAINDMRTLSRLSLMECDQLQRIQCSHDLDSLIITKCKSFTTLIADCNIRHINFIHTYNVSVVKLKGKSNFIDVSHNDKLQTLVGNSKHLNISHCKNVRDISTFVDLKGLDISNCVGITDISMLTKLKVLNIDHCTGITDISMLLSLERLNMRNCTGITDISMLTSLELLKIDGCSGITNINTLKNLRILYADDCVGITDVSELLLLENLHIDRCTGITDISMLKNLRKLSMVDCTGITSIGSLQYLEEWDMDSCRNVVSIGVYPNIRKACLHKCCGVRDISGLSNVSELNIVDCAAPVGEEFRNLKKLSVTRWFKEEYDFRSIEERCPGIEFGY